MKLKTKTYTPILRLLQLGMIPLAVDQSLHAATGTWNGPSLTANWDTTDANWTGVAAGNPWASQGNNATIDTSGNTISVTLNIAVDNWTISSSGNRVSIGAGLTVNENIGNATFQIYGAGHTSIAEGNILTINGTFNFGPTSNSSDVFRLGSDNASNASSYNGIVINAGGLLKRNDSPGGTHNDQVGRIAGSDYNYVDINGGTLNRQGNQRFYIGVQGSYNNMTIRNGGLFTGTSGMTTWGGSGNRVLHIGDTGGGGTGTGGSNNYVNVNGLGSVARITQVLVVGNGSTATDNYLKIENQGVAYVAFSGNTTVVGQSSGANNNYIQVTGTGSQLNMSNSANATRSLTIGGASGADNNHLDVFSGALADLRTGVVLGQGGATNSKFNLGDGTGISEAKVGQSAVTAGAIQLNAANSKLIFKSGRLNANADGSLVSGIGQIVLTGAAYVTSSFAGSTIANEVTGAGKLTKEGTGTISFTSTATSTFTGDTVVNNGTLSVSSPTFFDNAADVTIGEVAASPAKLRLSTGGATDVVDKLFIDGVQMPSGTYGSTSSLAANQDDSTFDNLGDGILQVTSDPGGSAYDAWSTTTHSLANPAFDFDSDKDCLPNGIEWVLGGNPNANDSPSVLPTASGTAAGGLTLVFNRSSDSITETTLVVEWGSVLSGFANSLTIGTVDVGPSGNNPTIDIDAPSVGKVTVNIPAANAVGGKILARLKATRNP